MLDCSVSLIGERDSFGGSERLLDIEEQLKAAYRVANKKPLKGALGRRER
jgi:hypothetical protein